MEYRGRRYGSHYSGNGPFRNLPPWERLGWLHGIGAEGAATVDSYSCQRFPLLQRRWWAYTDAKIGEKSIPSAEQSKQIIEHQIAAAESHIATLRKRLVELEPGEKNE